MGQRLMILPCSCVFQVVLVGASVAASTVVYLFGSAKSLLPSVPIHRYCHRRLYQSPTYHLL